MTQNKLSNKLDTTYEWPRHAYTLHRHLRYVHIAHTPHPPLC